jgi:hypothetical protein
MRTKATDGHRLLQLRGGKHTGEEARAFSKRRVKCQELITGHSSQEEASTDTRDT